MASSGPPTPSRGQPQQGQPGSGTETAPPPSPSSSSSSSLAGRDPSAPLVYRHLGTVPPRDLPPSPPRLAAPVAVAPAPVAPAAPASSVSSSLASLLVEPCSREESSSSVATLGEMLTRTTAPTIPVPEEEGPQVMAALEPALAPAVAPPPPSQQQQQQRQQPPTAAVAAAEQEEEEEEEEDDDFVRIEPEMHKGHVDVRVVKEGWLQRQCFRVVDGRPTIWRHFALWKRRYFVLGSDGVLRYYRDAEMQRFRRAIPLAGMEVQAHFYDSSSSSSSTSGGGAAAGGGEGDDGERGERSVPPPSTGEALLTGSGGRCFILRPKQTPQALHHHHGGHGRRSRGGSGEGGALLGRGGAGEEEMKLLAPSREEMLSWLEALRGEVEASERQGRSLFNSAWSLIRSYIDRSPTELLRQQEGEGEGEDGAAPDFVHVDASAAASSEQEEAEPPPPPHSAPEADVSFVPPSVPIPRMAVVLMVVGTRGDIQPFVALGKLLKANGHRVRLATHVLYRPLVEEAALEFYPLGGDPMKLSAYMVKTSGRIFPKLYDPEEMTKDLPEQMAMLGEIINSTWPACTAPDPEDPHQRPFLADAIISNPVTYGHIHVAEALRIPLHIMFPQPWSPTKAFPHPLSGLPYHGRWCKENYYSYIVVDKFLWLGIRDIVNELRSEKLGLEPLRLGEHGGELLNHLRVPFAKMWSPRLVPKPKDWGPHIDVVGNFFDPAPGTPEQGTPPGAEALERWLARGEPPIFIGFGSMVIPDARSLVATIMEAARLTGARVVMQSSWTRLTLSGSGEGESDAPPAPEEQDEESNIFCIGNCPHDWLLKRCAAVIHHGGSGTVAAGLRAGKPTMVCPFFGDQFFWGQMVYQAKVGVKPVPVVQLTPERLAASFQELRRPEMVEAAGRMAAALAQEDGAKEGMRAFYRHLPVEDMVCDVSLFAPSLGGPARPLVARKYCAACGGLKLSLEAHAALHLVDGCEGRDHDVLDYWAVDWRVAAGPRDAAEGLVQGITSFTHEFLGSMAGVVTEPVAGAHKRGVRGAARGLASGLANLIRRPIRGGFILVDKVATGVSNQRQQQQQQQQQQRAASSSTTTTDGGGSGPAPSPSGQPPPPEDAAGWRAQLQAAALEEARRRLTPALVAELRAAQAEALRCKKLFMGLSKGDPCVVPKDGVLGLVEEAQQPCFRSSKVLCRALLDRIDAGGAGQISFQQFCVFVRALKQAQREQEEDAKAAEAQAEAEARAKAAAEAEARAKAAAGEEQQQPQLQAEEKATTEPAAPAGATAAAASKYGLDSLIFDSIFLEQAAAAAVATTGPAAAVHAAPVAEAEDEEDGEGEGDRDETGSQSSGASSIEMDDIEVEVNFGASPSKDGGSAPIGSPPRGESREDEEDEEAAAVAVGASAALLSTL